MLNLTVLIGLFVERWSRTPDTTALLWQTSLGTKRLVGSVIYLGGCFLLNRAFGQRPLSAVFWVVQVGLALVFVIVFVLPVVNVLLIGPAAIQIQRNLLAS